MDCEKFEDTLIDELYDELDELTSAAAKRHASGCSKCAALLNGLRATRKIAVLPVVMPPADLEERILLAARDAQKVVPLRSRFTQAVSWAGSWAMRPQTAMAAVFLLAIGSSFVLMRSKSEMAPATVHVKAEGSPVAAASATPGQGQDLDTTSAAGAHGTEEKQRAAATPALLPPTDVPAASGTDLDGLLAGNELGRKALAKDDPYGDKEKVTNAGPPAGAPPPMATAAAEGQMASGGGGGAPVGGGWAAPSPAAAAHSKAGPVDFTTAMNAYRARRFDEATSDFDSLSASDPNAALWAARSVRDGQGCAAAVARFDRVATGAFGTPPGYEATLDGGRCYRDIGNTATARAKFSTLLSVPAYADRAQEELDKMSPQAAKKSAAPAARSVTQAPNADANGL